MIDHDKIAAQVRREREQGTPGPWSVSNAGTGNNVQRAEVSITVALTAPSAFAKHDARRIAALPDLEAVYLDLYDEVQRLRTEARQWRRQTYTVEDVRAWQAEAERDKLRAALARVGDSLRWQSLHGWGPDDGTWALLWPGYYGPFTACWINGNWTMCEDNDFGHATVGAVITLPHLATDAIPAADRAALKGDSE